MSEIDDRSCTEKVDLRGLICPVPVLRTKKLLDNTNIVRVEALVDSEINVNNLSRLARSMKCRFASQKREHGYLVTMERNLSGSQEGSPEKVTDSVQSNQPKRSQSEVGDVIFLGKDKFGDGDPQFSATLINLFLQTVFESGQRPRAILMANSGVRLMASDSPCLKVLEDFQKAGSEVLVCGLCVDFYDLKESVPQEQITNMFAICEYMFAADKVIAP